MGCCQPNLPMRQKTQNTQPQYKKEIRKENIQSNQPVPQPIKKKKQIAPKQAVKLPSAIQPSQISPNSKLLKPEQDLDYRTIGNPQQIDKSKNKDAENKQSLPEANVKEEEILIENQQQLKVVDHSRSKLIRQSSIVVGEEHLQSTIKNKTGGDLKNLWFQKALQEYTAGNYQSSISFLQKAPLIIKYDSNNSPAYADLLNLFALNYREMGRYEQAIKYYGQAYKIYNQRKQENEDVARILNSIGLLYQFEKEQYDKALLNFKKALKINTNIYGKKNINVAANYNNIANVYFSKGQFLKAQQTYKKVLKIKQKNYGEHHKSIALTLYNLAICYFQDQQYQKAIENYEKSLSMMKNLKLWNHPHTKERVKNLENCLEFLCTRQSSQKFIVLVNSMLKSVFSGMKEDKIQFYKQIFSTKQKKT